MKKIINYLSLILIIAISISFVSCKKKEQTLTNYLFNEGYAALSYRGNWGFLNKNGEIFVTHDYDSATPFQDGYAILSKAGQYFVINQNGDGVTQGYLNIMYLGSGYFAFYKDKAYGVINAKDKVIIENKYVSVESYSNNVFVCKQNGFYGLVNKRGKEVSEFIYDSIEEFHYGYALAKRGEYYGFLNNDGKEIIPFDYTKASHFVGKYAYVETKDGNKYIITNRNKIAFEIPSGYSLYTFDEKYIVITSNETGKYSLYNYNNKELISDSSGIIIKNDTKCSYIASFDAVGYHDVNTYTFNIYRYSNLRKLASSKDVDIDYKIYNYYIDYVTSQLYLRYLNDDGSKSIIYCFDGNKLEMTEIVTTYYIRSISNGIVYAVDDNGLPYMINGQVCISQGFNVLTISFITTDGYIIYSDGTWYGAFDKTGNEVFKCDYSHIKTLYAINS